MPDERKGSFDPAIHVPGVWRCAKCSFQLTQSNLNASDGTVTARDEAGDHCPNDGSPLWRVTWKEYAEQACEYADQTLARMVAIERAALELIAWYGPFNPTKHPPEINGSWLRLEAALRRTH